MTLFSCAAHDAWLLLEADPAVKGFCERPVHVQGGAGRLIDFWVSSGRHAKSWVLSSSESEDPALPKSVQGVALRVLRRQDLLALDMRIHRASARNGGSSSAQRRGVSGKPVRRRSPLVPTGGFFTIGCGGIR